MEQHKKTEQELIQDFQNEYKDLCMKHNLQIRVDPIFRARDDGTFSVVLQISFEKLK